MHLKITTLLKSFIFALSACLNFQATAVSLDKAFINLANKVKPSVVNISITKQGENNFIELIPGLIVPHATPKLTGSGSGFIISKEGLVVTNAHVVSQSDKIQVQFEGDKKLYPAKILGKDALSDIALLKVSAQKKFVPIEFGDSEKLKVGEWVAAIGNPHGYGHTITKGILSAVNREIDELNLYPLLQTDASINPGNSGGPLVNLRGQVIGVNNAIAAGATGIGFAIPINNVKIVLKDLKSYGYVRRGFIGIVFRSLPNKGVLITDIVDGGPADKAGLKQGDILTHFDSKAIKQPKDLPKIVDKTPVGKKVIVKVLRNKKPKQLTISSQPLQKDSFSFTKNRKALSKKGVSISKAGLQVANPSSGLLNQLQIPNLGARYPLVTKVQPNSRAQQAGIEVGDLVFKVNGESIFNANHLKAKLQKGGLFSLQILRYHRHYDQYLGFTTKLKL